MEISLCQLCKSSAAQLLCKCTSIYLCEQCIGAHIMQVFNVKHKPVKISSTDMELSDIRFPVELESAIHSKLSNELLELEEFRKLALQKISELLQQAEKQLLETAERTLWSLSDVCEIAHKDITNAIALINYTNNSENYILNIFKSCKTPEEVRDLQIVHKSLEYVPFRVAELMNKSICFNLQITDKPSKVTLDDEMEKLILNFDSRCSWDFKKSETKLEDNEDPEFPKPAVRKTISNIELELLKKEFSDRRVSRASSKVFQSINTTFMTMEPCIFNFIQNTDRIVWFNTRTSSWHEHHAANHIFLKDSAWSLCEGGQIMNTGGYEFQAKDSVFLFNLTTMTEEKAPSLPNRRCKHAQVSLGNFVYVIGGVSKKGALKSVDKFNLETGKWRNAGNMSQPREFPGACRHDGKLYIAGGVGVQSIELYNPLTKKFSLLNIKMSEPGRNCLFSYDDYIIILRVDTLTKFIPKSMSTIERAKVMKCDWVMKGDPYITNNSCFFFFFNEVFNLNLLKNEIEFIDQLP